MRIEMLGQPQLLQEKERPTILVVDDEELIRDLCLNALKGYRVLQAENGREALDILAGQPVDLVLADIMMPVMNGLELLLKIKERDPNQLVVIMTGYADKEIILRALKADADDFIQKPINLLQLKTSLEKALEKKSLHRQLSQIRQLDRIKADFLGLISHKLRTPTTSISLFIQNLASSSFDTSDPSFREALKAIREESDYLAYLIQDLLYYSDIILQDERPRLSREDLRDVAVSVLAEKRAMAAEKEILLHNRLTGNWPRLAIDRRRIAFALSALLDNAIKFSPRGSQVTLAGSCDDDEVTLAIADTGPGIPETEIPKIFEKFYQIDPGNTGQVRGFGLGLFYARQFVRDHGGSMTLESSPGAGTVVTICLPRKTLAALEPVD
ncbi:MAG: HAMP domain-containing sensor histidine kinase [Desulfuromonadales bacterium]|nr:HAMP domain-containing sensor histidine kinase [Desulfuromonadales bacterium]